MKFTVNPNCRQFGQHAVAYVGFMPFPIQLFAPERGQGQRRKRGDALSDTKSARNALMAQYEFKNQRHVGVRVFSWAAAWHAELSPRAIVVPIEQETCLIAV